MRQRILLKVYDILLCFLILTIAAIPLTLLIIIKLIVDGKPLFFNSKRLGKDGTPFTVFKFRTMVNDRKFIQNYLSTIDSGGFEKIPLEAVVYTKMGRLFERFQIVEIPQLLNVLQGNMSIIGYRPLPASHVSKLKQELGTELITQRHSVMPGITGMSQIVGKIYLSNAERVVVENNYNEFVQTRSSLEIIFYNSLIILETLLQIVFNKVPLINFLKKKILYKTPPVYQIQSETDIHSETNYILIKEKSEAHSLELTNS